VPIEYESPITTTEGPDPVAFAALAWEAVAIAAHVAVCEAWAPSPEAVTRNALALVAAATAITHLFTGQCSPAPAAQTGHSCARYRLVTIPAT
jgi:hypothetical protein